MIYLASKRSFDYVRHCYFHNNEVFVVEIREIMDYDTTTDMFCFVEQTYYYKYNDITIVEEFVYKLPKKLRYIDDINQIQNILDEMIFNKL